MADDLESWDTVIDFALGQANRVLRAASDALVTVSSPEDLVAGGIQLAEAWEALAAAWIARQSHEVTLCAVDSETSSEDEPEDDPASTSSWPRR